MLLAVCLPGRALADPPVPPTQSAPAQTPPPGGGGIGETIQRIFQTITSVIYFPAKTFQLAVEGAARATFTKQIKEMRGPLMGVLQVMNFSTVAMDSGVARVAANMTTAAVPLWGLSLALMLLAVITRQATGSGYGHGMLGEELVKWFVICLLSGNAYALILKTHEGFAALTSAALGGTGAAEGLADKLLLVADATHVVVDTQIPLIVLIVGVIVALVITLVLALAYAARVAMLFAIAALGPLCIATEGIPPLRFVCRDWLNMYFKVELIGVLNAVILSIGGTVLATLRLDGSGLVGLAGAVGLAAALIAVNVATFQQVFGTAVGIAGQMGQAVGSVVALAAGVGMLGATGGLSGGAALSSLGGGRSTFGAGNDPSFGQLPAMGGTGAGSDGSQPSGGTRSPQSNPAVSSRGQTSGSAGAERGRAAAERGMAQLPSAGALRATAMAQMIGQATGSKVARAMGMGGMMGDRIAGQQQSQSAQGDRDSGAQAADFGARSEADKSSVGAALKNPVSQMNGSQTHTAAQQAAPMMRDMVERMGGTAPVAQAMGAGDFGEAASMMTSVAGEANGWSTGAPDVSSRLSDVPVDAKNWEGMQYRDYGMGLEVAQKSGHMEDAVSWAWRAQWMRTQDPAGALSSDFISNVRSLPDGFSASDGEGALKRALEANAGVGGAQISQTLSNAMLHSPARFQKARAK